MLQKALQRFIILIVILPLFTLIIPGSVHAQAGTAADLINAVNQLRQNMGLSPFTTDTFLMGFAQSHSDYMASLGTWTHTRADGSTSFDQGIKENVAMGSNMSVQHCVNTIWSDWTHWQTMTAFASGKVGAGVAVKDGTVFYTLNVLPDESEINQPIEASSIQQVDLTSIPNQLIAVSQLITVTPIENGSIVHTVRYGETLWTISEAYQVPIDQILTNTGLSQGTTEVLEGQDLVIRPPLDPTATPTLTVTPVPNTPTPTQPRPTMTPFPTRTPLPTPTPTTPPSALQRIFSDGRDVGLGLVFACGLGLILVFYLGFVKKQ